MLAPAFRDMVSGGRSAAAAPAPPAETTAPAPASPEATAPASPATRETPPPAAREASPRRREPRRAAAPTPDAAPEASDTPPTASADDGSYTTLPNGVVIKVR
jgi:hypothetical protein